MLLEGHRIDRYLLLHRIGKGGMGEVYLAEDERIAQRVAIKLIRAEDDTHKEEHLRLFQREAKAVARLDHPNILPLFDYGETTIDGILHAYLVMPFRQEGTLSDWLSRLPETRPLTSEDIAYFIGQAAAALQHAHDQHILHQDVKPSNFLIRSRLDQPDRPDLLLADFGLAKFYLTTSHMSQEVRGTPLYMAPEQWDGRLTPASDQYSLAIMAYQLLTGKPPFRGNLAELMHQHFEVQARPISELNLSLPKDLDFVFAHALAKKPEERFASVSAFARAFQLALIGAASADSLSAQLSPLHQTIRETQTIIAGEVSEVDTLTPHISGGITSVPTPTVISDPTPQTPVSTPHITPIHPPRKFSSLLPTLDEKMLASVPRWKEALRGKTLWLVGLALLIILASSGLFYTVKTNADNRARATATARAATATSVANSANPYIRRGTLLLNDPLQNNSHGYGWDEITKPARSCHFNNGAYLVQALKSQALAACTAQNMNFSNFTLEVKMRFLTSGYGGILFRTTIPESKFYYFQILSSGDYALYLYKDQFLDHNKNLIDITHIPAPILRTVKQQTYLLAVVANGDTIDLYVNHQHLQTVHDNTVSQGQISFTASGFTSPVKILYSDARVWKL